MNFHKIPDGAIITTTTTSTTVVSAYWSFDNNTNDLYGVYGGSIVNGASYLSPTTSPYVYSGSDQAIRLQSTSNQSVSVSTFFNLTYTSFTVEAWIYPQLVTTDNTIFGQCACTACTNQCLYLIIRSSHLYMGFNFNDLAGTATLTASTWYHVEFVYNYQTLQQIIYLDGVQDSIRSNVQPYQGQNGSITIGISTFLPANYYNGYIDNMALTTRYDLLGSDIEVLLSRILGINREAAIN
ncbi:unnamed protein product [Didymodactylos carnosus]|uniref:LamG domain-containing protein n=1 Tax=Didymodactylos carnosus TaxID=1234261 RepID=A0A8S2PCF3_9BILA|nr:unnamed protein product [Didymodactylos carnosus]CAF4045794.1 unnamed protein product [Didymodactylos carnosus]